jgi:hypothetical protein
MSGTLYHSKEFTAEEYLGCDNRVHFEVMCVDGDSLGLSHASWREMKQLAEAHGMPPDAWPEFLAYDFGIDVPLDEVRSKQNRFRTHLLRLPSSVLAEHYWLGCVAEWVRRGEAVFFCGN